MSTQLFIPFKQLLQKVFVFLLFLILVFIGACSGQPELEQIPTGIPLPKETPTTTITIPTIVPAPQQIGSSISEFIPSPTPYEMVVPTLLPTLPMTCPVVINNSLPIQGWPDGSILFNTGKLTETSLWLPQIDQDGIWAISSGMVVPQLLYQEAKHISIAPNGNTLVSFKPAPATNDFIMVFYSILTGESVEITVPSPAGEPLRGYLIWLPDGRIVNIIRKEQLLGVGEIWDTVFIDLPTQTIESTRLEFSLPEYEFSEHNVELGIPAGIISVDPTFQRILYTAGNNRNHLIRLLDTDTGEILWQEQSAYLINTSPQWTENGQKVLFEVALIRQDIPPETGPNGDWYIPYTWTKLISLSRDGLVEELPNQPFLGLLDHRVNNFSRSPSGRYIFYNFYDHDILAIRAYIVDTLTGKNQEICDPQSSWFASWPNNLPGSEVEVYWSGNDQLIYRVLIGENNQWFHSLRVLDIPTWTSHIVFETNPEYGIKVFGWTPVESFLPQ